MKNIFESPEEFEAKLRGIYPVVKETLTTEKPDFFNHDSSKGNLPSEMPNYVDPLEGFAERAAKQAEKPKYLKAKNGLVLKLIKPIDNSTFEAKVVYAGNSTHDVDKISGWYFAEFEPCDYTEPVEVSPETEQQKETIADCGKKTLMDNPSLADNIGSHMNLAFDYAKKLVNENTRLRAQLYRLPILEQENAELKAQLAAKNELLSNTEQLPVGTIVYIVIEFANKKGYRMLHISEPNYTCKKAFEWANNQATIVEGIIISYDYTFPPKKQ